MAAADTVARLGAARNAIKEFAEKDDVLPEVHMEPAQQL